MQMGRYFCFFVLVALAACGSGDSSPGGLTPEQNETLDKAAQKLDEDRAGLPIRQAQGDKPQKSDAPAPAAQ